MTATDDLWIFGYGSLIWRPDFPYEHYRDGYILGLARRFYQGSPDHRGQPGAMGRVVTLLPEPDAVCRGRAFKIAPRDKAAVTDHLDRRETGGYERYQAQFHAPDTAPFQVTVYVATPSNSNYLGPAPVPEMARQILAARGDSGSNREYLLELADALRDADMPDPHVFELATEVRRQLAASPDR